jgi:topoisomerase-4 subunit A
MSLKEVLQAYLNHRVDVLNRVSKTRLGQISNRLEILHGLLIAYLNLDEVIRIIREEDEPKSIMMTKWSLSDLQVESILNTRLRSLRKLEEMEIRRETGMLEKEKGNLEKLLASFALQMKEIEKSLKSLLKNFGKETKIGARRTLPGIVPDIDISIEESTIEKEPMTLVLSKKGWIRCFKGHEPQREETLKYKDGDSEKFILQAQSTDRIICFSNLGKSYTLSFDKLPKGRGFGEPINLLLDLKSNEVVILMAVFKEGEQYLVVSTGGRGFFIESSQLLSSTKNGKNVLNLDEAEEAFACLPKIHDWIAFISEKRKLLIFKADEVPIMSKGKGVILQKCLGSYINDICFIDIAQGMKWKSGERIRHETDLSPWIAKRAQTGRLAPTGFPRSNKFELIWE